MPRPPPPGQAGPVRCSRALGGCAMPTPTRTADRVAAATPAERDRFADLLRVASIVVVVAGHWLMAVVGWRGGRVEAGNAIALAPGLFFPAEHGIRVHCVTGVQTCALPISAGGAGSANSGGATRRYWPNAHSDSRR